METQLSFDKSVALWGWREFHVNAEVERGEKESECKEERLDSIGYPYYTCLRNMQEHPSEEASSAYSLHVGQWSKVERLALSKCRSGDMSIPET
ncbi:hypothetical protein MTR_6g053780 [Medicago truncatula]|uniref:Uncharacterized protein n=1 Tax=Medicago truncatula TaxID=3880 RepID=A0A072U9V9_MEDTR|nr:hypothetical protein MTR_6g053780 [Medicago truncatula]